MHLTPREKITRNKPKLVFVSTTRLHYDSTGRLRSYNPLMSAHEWEPFFDVFANVLVLARVDEADSSDEGYILDTTRLRVEPIPFYDGLFDYLRKARSIKRFVATYLTDPHAVYFLRVPSILSLSAAKRIKRLPAPLITRVMGDPGGVSKAILPFPVNHLSAIMAVNSARRTIKLSDGVIYVTLRSLQEVYPANTEALTLARTNIQFSSDLLSIPKKCMTTLHKAETVRLIAVGSQQQNYKGHDLLIEAVSKLQRQGYSLSLTLVGSGRLHTQLHSQASSANLQEVHFIEHLGTSADVARHVTEHDLFIMPSRTEGMPKVLLEAMSVGVLSIGSTVGGIPEVLSDACTFPPASASALAEKIQLMIDNPTLAKEQLEVQAKMVETIKNNHSGSPVLARYLRRFVEHFSHAERPQH